jgi:Trypsin-like peptidase domain
MIFLLTTLLTVLPSAQALSIYGPDNRSEISVAQTRTQSLAQSTPALLENRSLEHKNGQVKILSSSLGETLLLCSEEKFKDQSAAAICSGVLVAEDLILTAAHCYEDEDRCSGSSWVFNYRLDAQITSDDVFACKEVAFLDKDRDFALIRLERNSKNKVIGIKKAHRLEVGSEIFMLGYPSGIPLKLTDGGHVLKDEGSSVLTDLDAFEGNSGSGIFNQQTFELEGLLSTGMTDYSRKTGCTSSILSDPKDGSEKVTKLDGVDSIIKGLQSRIPKLTPQSEGLGTSAQPEEL